MTYITPDSKLSKDSRDAVATVGSVPASTATDVFDALDRVGEAVEAAIKQIGDWNIDSAAPGWSIAQQVAHLRWTDLVSLVAITSPEKFVEKYVSAAWKDPVNYTDKCATETRLDLGDRLHKHWTETRLELADTLRSFDPQERIPWFGPPMKSKSMASARIMETWAHGLDIADATGQKFDVPAALPHVARLGFRTRDYAFMLNQLSPPEEPFYLSLTDFTGKIVTFGAPESQQTITGSLIDFCRVVTQRTNLKNTALVATGDEAKKWLTIAQAFAGPPGVGR